FKHHILFLYEAALMIPQLREREEDQMWLDLLRDATERIAAGVEIREICNGVRRALTTHIGNIECYVRVANATGRLERLADNSHFAGGVNVQPADVPFIRGLLDLQGSDSVHVDRLSTQQVGRATALAGYRMIGAAMYYGAARIGTCTVLRPPTTRAFRER